MDPSKGAASTLGVVPGWLRWMLAVVPIMALGVSLFSLALAYKSMRFTQGYTRGFEDHEVVARVLGVGAFPRGGFSSIVTNGELFVDLAVVNKGNQKEIIREASLWYSATNHTRGAAVVRQPIDTAKNIQLEKGEKRVLHLLSLFNSGNTGKRMWVGIRVRAIGPDANDVETEWPVCQIDLAPDGNRSEVSYNKDKTPVMKIITRDRLPEQRLALDGF